MKKLLLVNGPMGVGKTTTCRLLLEQMQPCAFLDGDWCWTMSPFLVTEENKQMVVDNIVYILRAYLKNSGFESVVFCWVLHRRDTFQTILDKLKDIPFELHAVSLICSPDELKRRLDQDRISGNRNTDVSDASIARLPLYEMLPTLKIDTTNLTPGQTVRQILRLIN